MGLEKHIIDIVSLSEAEISEIRSNVTSMKEYLLKERMEANAGLIISNRLTRSAALKSAGLGGLVSTPSGIPGLGTIGSAVAGAAVDTFYLTKIQAKLCHGISEAFGADMDREEMKTVVLVLIGFAGTANAAKEVIKAGLKEGVEVFARRFVRRGAVNSAEELAEKIGMRTAGRTLPLIGIPVGAAANYYSTMLVGRKAKEYFRDDSNEQKG